MVTLNVAFTILTIIMFIGPGHLALRMAGFVWKSEIERVLDAIVLSAILNTMSLVLLLVLQWPVVLSFQSLSGQAALVVYAVDVLLAPLAARVIRNYRTQKDQKDQKDAAAEIQAAQAQQAATADPKATGEGEIKTTPALQDSEAP